MATVKPNRAIDEIAGAKRSQRKLSRVKARHQERVLWGARQCYHNEFLDFMECAGRAKRAALATALQKVGWKHPVYQQPGRFPMDELLEFQDFAEIEIGEVKCPVNQRWSNFGLN